MKLNLLMDTVAKKYKVKKCMDTDKQDSIISWVHYVEDVNTIDFIRGKELIITTGMGIKGTEDLIALIQSLINSKASALIINIGKYIDKVPNEVITFCEENNFPLFTMPWEIHLVDIMQECCNMLLKERQEQESINNILYECILNKKNPDSDVLERTGYQPDAISAVVQIELKNFCLDYECNITNLSNYEWIRLIGAEWGSRERRLSVIKHEKSLYAVYQVVNKEDAYEFASFLYKNVCDCGYKNCILGVSMVTSLTTGFQRSLDQAAEAVQLAKVQGKSLICYEDMGIYKVLFQVRDRNVLGELIKEQLEVIINYDEQHGTNYITTLELYLRCDRSIQSVAEKSYTHRNTVNYRIKKIKEIMNYDFSDAEKNFLILMSLYGKELVEVKV